MCMIYAIFREKSKRKAWGWIEFTSNVWLRSADLHKVRFWESHQPPTHRLHHHRPALLHGNQREVSVISPLENKCHCRWASTEMRDGVYLLQVWDHFKRVLWIHAWLLSRGGNSVLPGRTNTRHQRTQQYFPLLWHLFETSSVHLFDSVSVNFLFGQSVRFNSIIV